MPISLVDTATAVSTGAQTSLVGKATAAVTEKMKSAAEILKSPGATIAGTVVGWYAKRMAQVFLPGLIHKAFVWGAGSFVGGFLLSPLLTPTIATGAAVVTGIAVGYVAAKVTSAVINLFCPEKK